MALKCLLKHGQNVTICKSNTVKNYQLLKHIEPQKTKGCKKGRKSGGILLYCKSYLKPFIKILKSCPTHVWFEIGKDLFSNIPKRVRVCTLYCPPGTSKYYPEDLWDDLKTEILELTTNDTPFLLIGDMNARTGEILEFPHLNTPNFNCSPTRCVIESNRKKCGKTINNQGTKLINLYGRFRGDCWGELHPPQQK